MYRQFCFAGTLVRRDMSRKLLGDHDRGQVGKDPEQENRMRRVGGQAIGHHAAGGAAVHDDEVVVDICAPVPALALYSVFCSG
jgi:hypothetical protein